MFIFSAKFILGGTSEKLSLIPGDWGYACRASPVSVLPDYFAHPIYYEGPYLIYPSSPRPWYNVGPQIGAQ